VTKDRLDAILEKSQSTRRGMLKAMMVGSAFVVPMVASFSMDGRLTTSQALAQGSNATSGGGGADAVVTPDDVAPDAVVTPDDVAPDDVAPADDVGGSGGDTKY
jgi:hypothetical protein